MADSDQLQYRRDYFDRFRHPEENKGKIVETKFRKKQTPRGLKRVALIIFVCDTIIIDVNSDIITSCRNLRVDYCKYIRSR